MELWIDYIQGTSRRQDPIFTPWNALAVLGLEEFSQKAPDLLRELSRRGSDDRHRVNPRIVNALDSAPLASMTDVARTYGDLFTSVHNQWQSLLAQDPRATGLADPAEEELRQVLYGPTGPFALSTPEDGFFLHLTRTPRSNPCPTTLRVQQKLDYRMNLYRTGTGTVRSQKKLRTPHITLWAGGSLPLRN